MKCAHTSQYTHNLAKHVYACKINTNDIAIDLSPHTRLFFKNNFDYIIMILPSLLYKKKTIILFRYSRVYDKNIDRK